MDTWPAMREREKWDILEEKIFCGGRYFGSWNFGKLENHVVVEEGKK